MQKKEMIISTAEHYGKLPVHYTLLNKRVLGASLIADAWSYINIKWSFLLKITVGVKMADADRGVHVCKTMLPLKMTICHYTTEVH